MQPHDPVQPVATVQIRWFVEDDGGLRTALDLDQVATEVHERHRLWLATELARISRGIVDEIRRSTQSPAD
jgi:hypothetical protein